MSPTIKHLTFWMVASLVIFSFWSVSSRIQKNERQLSFSDSWPSSSGATWPM